MKPSQQPVYGGSVLVAREGELPLSCTLGSCISVVVVCRQRKMVGMNHILLPRRELASEGTSMSDTHFAPEAVRQLLKLFKEAGCQRTDLKVILVGGASNGAGPGVGPANVAEVRKILPQFGLKIHGERIGGTIGWQVVAYPESGTVEVRSLKSERKVRVLVVDDSATVRTLLVKALANDPKIEVVGQAAHGLEARSLISSLQPDLITLDIQMPVQSGLDLLKTLPLDLRNRVILVTDCSPRSGNEVMEGLALGAFDFLQKPSAREISQWGERLREMVKVSSQTKKVVEKAKISRISNRLTGSNLDLVLIGSSTGGTEVVREILQKLPENSPPVLVVQHMPAAFTGAFAARLDSLCRISVVEAADGQKPQRGVAYVAPGGKQMWLQEGLIRVKELPPVNRFAPSVDFLFQRVEGSIVKNAAAVLLTGMGADGAQGMLKLKGSGATTITQSQESCLVYGMPRAAVELGASMLSLSPQEIGEFLRSRSPSRKNAA